jgi:hypothetical protein
MIERGTVCVLRQACIDGVSEELIMPLNDQRAYREWAGCFSYIG